jgi:enterochelin esterase-like enzyme
MGFTTRVGLVFVLAVACAAIVASALSSVANGAEGPASPRLKRLVDEVRVDRAAALAAFWKECAGKCPLVEEIAGDSKRLLVTFLWRGDASVDRVEMRGATSSESRTRLTRLGETDVWYHSELLPKDSRFVYGFTVTRWKERREPNGEIRRALVEETPNDPLNPHQFNDGPVVELPDAPKDAWHVARKEVARGTVVPGILSRETIESAALKKSRGVTIYTPAKFDPRAAHAVAVFLDGEECEKLMSLPTVLDNLIADKKIPPTVALLVDAQKTRGRDLVFSDSFVKFLADELMPWAAKKTGASLASERTLIGGMSLGGLTAAYAAQKRPDVFGNVLSQSGAFWRQRVEQASGKSGTVKPDEGWLPGAIASERETRVRYYLEVGAFEPPSMINNNRRLRDILRKNGNDVTYDEYHGGHDHVNWRVSVGRGIVALLRTADK